MTFAQAFAEIRPLIRWCPTSTGLERMPLPTAVVERLPSEYLEALEVLGAGEGFVGQNYLRLYPLDELVAVNQAYQIETYLPGLVMFGSTGGGEAYGFLFKWDDYQIIRVPFVPLDLEYAAEHPAGFAAFLIALASDPPESEDLPFPPLINEEALGKEVHEKQPIALGGTPGPENQILVEPKIHAELCRFWNKVFARAKAESVSGA
jgi:hypothetical protein